MLENKPSQSIMTELLGQSLYEVCLLGGRCHCFGVYHLFTLCRFSARCQSWRCGGNAGVGIYRRAAL